MKRTFALLLTLNLFLGAACAPAPAAQPAGTEPSAQLPNPLVTVDGPDAFAPLGVSIDAPQGAENVVYTILSDEVAQVDFTLDGRDYTYRASLATYDIAGVYESFDEPSLGVSADGEGWYAAVTVRTIDGGRSGALAAFAYPPAQYTLYTPDAVAAEEMSELAVRLASVVCPRPAHALATPEATAPAALTDAQESALLHMHPVLDSILRTVGVGGDAVWPVPGSDESLWTALYLLGVNWCSEAPGTSVDGAYLVVPEQTMAVWAAALNNGSDALPAAPPTLPSMLYDADAKTYRLELSDAGSSETRMDAIDGGDGAYFVKLGLYDEDGVRLGGMEFVLADASFAAASDGAFPYVVRSAAAEPLL